MRPKTINVAIRKPDLLNAVCKAAEEDGEVDYNYWVRIYLRKNLKVKAKANRQGWNKK